MNINIKATHIDLTFEIKDYVNEKIGSLSRFLDQEQDINIFVEIGKESNHHQTLRQQRNFGTYKGNFPAY
jgi:ribosomal subunit interface protein